MVNVMDKFTKEEWMLLDDILGHVNIDVWERETFRSMFEKIKQLI